MRTSLGRRRPRLLIPLLAVTFLAATACGAAGSTADSKEAAGDTEAVLAAAEASLERGYTGNYTEPPKSGPAPASGKNIWIISAFQQVHALAYQSDQLSKAARDIGWTVNVCDGRNNAGGAWAECVRQAVAAEADGIVLASVDCAPVRQALVEARKADVKIASFSGFDCDDPSQGSSEALFDAPARHFADDWSMADFYQQLGKARADAVIAKTKGQAKIVHVAFQDVVFGTYVAEGFTSRIAECGSCEIVSTVKIAPPDVPVIRQKFETALLQKPQANVVAVDVDYFFVAGVQQALLAANRPELTVVGSECQREDLDYIRAGRGEQMCFGASSGYRAYSTIDALNRVFAGEKPVSAGVGLQLVDAEHNLPAKESAFVGPVDYERLYRKTWGA